MTCEGRLHRRIQRFTINEIWNSTERLGWNWHRSSLLEKSLRRGRKMDGDRYQARNLKIKKAYLTSMPTRKERLSFSIRPYSAYLAPLQVDSAS